MMEWINSEDGITLLRALVLMTALVWLLSGGFNFNRRRQQRRKERRDD